MHCDVQWVSVNEHDDPRSFLMKGKLLMALTLLLVLCAASSLTHIKNSLTEISWTTSVMPDFNFSYFNGSALNMTKNGFIPLSFILYYKSWFSGRVSEEMISTQTSQIQNPTKRSLLWDISMIKLHKSFISQTYIGLLRNKSHMFSKAYSEENMFSTTV